MKYNRYRGSYIYEWMEEKTTPKIKILKQDVYKVKKQFVKGRNYISKLKNIYQMIWYMQKL